MTATTNNTVPTWIPMATMLGIVVVCLLSPSAALADNKEDAKAKFKIGIEAFKNDKFEEALEAFIASDDLYHHPDTLVNIANCYAELYNFPKAMEYFERYMDEKGDELTGDAKKEIVNKMDRVGKKVGKIVILPENVSGVLLIDDESIGDLPLDKPLYMEAGLHQVQVKQDGGIVYQKQINVIGASKTEVEVTVSEPVDVDAEVEEDDGGGGETDEDDEADVEKPAKPKKAKKKKGALRVELAGDEVGTVFVDGEEMGETPFEKQYKEGYYVVEVRVPDSPAWEGEVEVKSAKHTVVTVDVNSTKKVPDPNNPLFWSMIGATVPTLVTGIVVSVFAKMNNDDANALFGELNTGMYNGDNNDDGVTNEEDEAIKQKAIQEQNDLVDLGDSEKKAAMALLITSGVFAATAVASVFIFRKEKPAAAGSFEISGVSPVLDPTTGTVGLGLSATF